MRERLAVCSWSLLPEGPKDLAEKLKKTGIARVQLALDPLRNRPETWGRAGEELENLGITVISGMVGCVGEDYATLESIRRTGGVTPDDTWEENLLNFAATIPIAQDLGIKLVTFHSGFVPAVSDTLASEKIRTRLTAISKAFEHEGITVGLETGQETATELTALLASLDCKNVKVNFDPANMILYGKGDPLEGMAHLAPWLAQVHVKDATASPIAGNWGDEVLVGTGHVDWPAMIATLSASGYDGDYAIEREAGSTRLADICHAREYIQRISP